MPPASVVWPAIQEAPKTLLCLRVHCNVDALFKTLVVNPELQVGEGLQGVMPTVVQGEVRYRVLGTSSS
jgi:hypothetical protein